MIETSRDEEGKRFTSGNPPLQSCERLDPVSAGQVRHAELSASALQNKKGLFEGHVTQFIRFKRLTYVFCISVDGWSDNRYWRWMHGWKFTKAT